VQSITNNIEKATRTSQEITRSQQRAFEALSNNFLSFQSRNAEVARGWSEFLKLQESNAKAAQDLFTSSIRFAEIQQRNVRFAREWMGYGVNFWRDQTENNVRTAEIVARSVSEQQEGVRKLAEQWVSTYEGFSSSWGSYAEQGLKDAQQATERATRQGLRVAEEAVEQTERAARQADPNRLPIEGYDELNVSEVSARLDGLTTAELKKVEAYEKRNKNRETVIEQIERKIKAAS
jgi:DNA polymerase sigma